MLLFLLFLFFVSEILFSDAVIKSTCFDFKSVVAFLKTIWRYVLIIIANENTGLR